MRNLRADIAEMFAELDGTALYEGRLVEWCQWRRQARREYEREYRKAERYRIKRRRYDNRYRRDRYWRDLEFRVRVKTADERHRDKILGPGRPRRTYGPVAISHGTYVAYTKRKCRCEPCRAAMAAYQRDYRKRRAA